MFSEFGSSHSRLWSSWRPLVAQENATYDCLHVYVTQHVMASNKAAMARSVPRQIRAPQCHKGKKSDLFTKKVFNVNTNL